MSNFLITKNMRDKIVTVYWTTNVPALSTIQYGSTGGMGTEKNSTSYGTAHSFNINIEYDNYYYLRVMSSSEASSELESSTVVSPVYRIDANTGSDAITRNPDFDDLPVMPVGGCGTIKTDSENGYLNVFIVIFLILLPVAGLQLRRLYSYKG
jgi:hypothetical protein